MTGEQFTAWMETFNLSIHDAARELDIHVNTIVRYRNHGAHRAIDLACSALFHRLRPWSER